MSCQRGAAPRIGQERSNSLLSLNRPTERHVWRDLECSTYLHAIALNSIYLVCAYLVAFESSWRANGRACAWLCSAVRYRCRRCCEVDRRMSYYFSRVGGLSNEVYHTVPALGKLR